MKCKRCKKKMDIFMGGMSGTFVPMQTRYICLDCNLQFKSDSKESGGDYNKYKWEKIVVEDEQ